MNAFLLLVGEVRNVESIEPDRNVRSVGRRLSTVRIAGLAAAAGLMIIAYLIFFFGVEPSEVSNDRLASTGGADATGGEVDSAFLGTVGPRENSTGEEGSGAESAAGNESRTTRELWAMVESLDADVDDLAIAYLGSYGEGHADANRRSQDGRLFLEIVESDAINPEVRGHAAWALRHFEETWEDLGSLLRASRGEESALAVIQGIPSASVNETPEIVVRSLIELVERGSTPLRRKAASKLVRYGDPEGAYGRVCLSRIMDEDDPGTLRHLLGSFALEQAFALDGTSGRHLADSSRRIMQIAKGVAVGDWENATGRAIRSTALRLLAKVRDPGLTALFIDLAQRDRLLAHELIFVFLQEPELLQVLLKSARSGVYEAFGRILLDDEVDQDSVLKALLKADGSGTIAGLNGLEDSEPEWTLSVALMLFCEEELFAGSGDKASLEQYLLDSLAAFDGSAGRKLFGLGHLLVRVGTDKVRKALLEASQREDLALLARSQLFLAWLQMGPDTDAVTGQGRDPLDAVLGFLHSRDPEEVLAVLAGAVPLPISLRSPDFLDVLVSVVQQPTSNLPAFPFLAIPELYRLRSIGAEIPADLSALSASFLTHEDWRVRLAMALARLDSGDGSTAEVSAVLRSVDHALLTEGSHPEVLSDEQIAELRDQVARIRPYSLTRIVTGRRDPKSAGKNINKLRSRLEEKRRRLSSLRDDAAQVAQATFAGGGAFAINAAEGCLPSDAGENFKNERGCATESSFL